MGNWASRPTPGSAAKSPQSTYELPGDKPGLPLSSCTCTAAHTHTLRPFSLCVLAPRLPLSVVSKHIRDEQVHSVYAPLHGYMRPTQTKRSGKETGFCVWLSYAQLLSVIHVLRFWKPKEPKVGQKEARGTKECSQKQIPLRIHNGDSAEVEFVIYTVT